MQKQGTVVRWDEARGFGFIRSAASSMDVFFHVRDFRPGSGVLPRLGLAVTFEEIHVGGKGPRAMAVQVVGESAASSPQFRAGPALRRRTSFPSNSPTTAGSSRVVALMLVYGGGLLWATSLRALPWWVLIASPLLNLLAFYAYWLDKYAAEKRRWRIKEDTLHFWSLAGGWVGAWFAQQVLRHKSRKTSFQQIYWFTVLLHCAACAVWALWPLSLR